MFENGVSVESLVADEMSVSRLDVGSGGFRSTVKVYDGKNVYCDAAESVLSFNPKLEKNVGFVRGAMYIMNHSGMPYVHGLDVVRLRANRRAANSLNGGGLYSNASFFDKKRKKSSSKMLQSIRLTENYRSKMKYRKLVQSKTGGEDVYHYQSWTEIDGITLFIDNKSVYFILSKNYEKNLVFCGKKYKSLYGVCVAAVWHFMKSGVLYYGGKDVGSQSAVHSARYRLRRYFRINEMECSVIFDSDLSVIARIEGGKSARKKYENTHYFGNNQRCSEKSYVICDTIDNSVQLLKTEITLKPSFFWSNKVLSNVQQLKSFTDTTQNTDIMKVIQKKVNKMCGVALPKSKKVIQKKMNTKQIEIDNRTSISYLFDVVGKLERNQRQMNETQRQMNERLKRLEHNQRTILNNKN